MKTYINNKKLTLFISLFFFSIISFSQNSDEKSENSDEKSINEKKEKKKKNYSDVINDKAITDYGLFDVHKVDEKYYYEINDSLL